MIGVFYWTATLILASGYAMTVTSEGYFPDRPTCEADAFEFADWEEFWRPGVEVIWHCAKTGSEAGVP